ncbi:exodeoxyribonuclease VII small subunit [Engelhardtia mirabilis]|uniref:Exodeoxyribonuclease 7 small subunit n=1 Tax=Engelhardtia mirabilis TaxID=2528011 RepID=A0A518BJU8_9BACT|nr:Exodeoxyribonuclease 7 small subunit [Planctomycetes bacterium Pla133]QDV01569.1 Exodeoxyribonuclease 7 small subunit [Planctomycetes bacterium Pla86]
MAKNTSNSDGAAEELGFDERLERLESIVSELEAGDLGLEPAIERYTSGIELLKSCHATLAAQRARVEELTADADRALRPFEGDPDLAGGE